MKKYSMRKIEKVVVSEVTCDDCGKDCTTVYHDVLIKPSYSEDILFVKSICYDCYEKNFKETIIKNRNEDGEEFGKVARKIIEGKT